jgi:flagellar basal body-associated protein FliL
VAASQSSSSSNTPIPSSQSKAGLIAGVVIAVIVVVIAAVAALFFWRRAKHRRGEYAHKSPVEMTQADGSGAAAMKVPAGHSNTSDIPEGHDLNEMHDAEGFMSRNR